MGRWIALPAALLCAAAFPVLASGDQDSGSRGAVVEKIVVQMDGQAGEQNIEELISIKQGEAYSLKKVDQSIKQIFRTGQFEDVRVEKSGDARVQLTFILIHRLMTRSVNFIGGDELPRGKMKQGVEAVRQGSYFAEDKIAQAAEELRGILRDDGFFDAAVETAVTRDVAASAADVSFKIGSWKRLGIARIAFEGNTIVPEGELIHRMKTGPGSPYIPSSFREDLRRLKEFYAALGYQRAAVETIREDVDAGNGSVGLTVRIDPGEKISFVTTGAVLPKNLLEPIWEEQIFEEWGLAEGEARILSYLRKEGFVFASLKSRIERRENEILVIYDINPGTKFRVDRVEFEGLASFPPSRIREEVGLSEKVPFFALVDGERLFEIPGEIELFYETNGFPGSRVTLNLKSRIKAATAVFFIEEGPRQKIDGIAVQGVTMFPPEAVPAVMISAEGGPFYEPNLRKDADRIETFYLDQGVRGTRAKVEARESSPNSFALSVTVEEGSRIRIGDVVIAGNRVTRKKTILREILVRGGDPASRRLLLESKRRLESLGIFADVKVDEVATAADVANVVFTVREGSRNYASLGVGLETRNEPRSLALWENNIRLRGTAEFIRSNVFGTAAQVSLVSQFSLIEKRAVLSWEQPYFLGIPMQTYLNAFLEGEDRTSFGFDRRGVSINTVKPFPNGFLLLATISLSRTRLTFLDIMESEVDRQLLPYSTAMVSGSFMWDRRNDTFNPEKGFFMSVVGEWAYPVFGTESDYLKTFFKFQYYYPIRPRVNFNTTFRLGLGRGKIPVPERFFAGGSNSFRGETIDRLGPKDPVSNQPVGGKAMFLVNLELKFPLFQSLQNLSGAVFYDLGQVYSNRSDFSLFAFRGALGFGLRYRTPLGPVRIDLGWKADDPEKKRKPLVFITIGNIF